MTVYEDMWNNYNTLYYDERPLRVQAIADARTSEEITTAIKSLEELDAQLQIIIVEAEKIKAEE